MEWVTNEILFTYYLFINFSLDLTTLNYQLEVYVKSFLLFVTSTNKPAFVTT